MNLGELAALASALSWGATTVMLRSQSARIDPLSLNTLRSVIGAVFFVLAVFVLRKADAFASVTPLVLLALCGSLTFGFVIGDTLLFRSMQLVGVSTALPLSMTYPLYVLAIAWAFLGERITVFTVLGTVVVIVGTITIALGGRSVGTHNPRDHRLGVTLAIVSALCFAASTSILKLGVQDVDVVIAGAIRMSITAVVLLLWRSSAASAPPFRAYGLRALSIVAIASIVGSGIGTITYLTAVQQAGAAIAASLATTAPLFAAPLSVLFGGERLSPRVLLGMVLCVAGVWLVIPR